MNEGIKHFQSFSGILSPYAGVEETEMTEDRLIQDAAQYILNTLSNRKIYEVQILPTQIKPTMVGNIECSQMVITACVERKDNPT